MSDTEAKVESSGAAKKAEESLSSSARQQDTDAPDPVAPNPAAPGAKVESSSAGKEAGSSSAGQVAMAPPPPQRNWVALVSAPRILAADDERARAMAEDARRIAELDLVHAPRPSYLVLHPRIVAPDLGNLAQQGDGSACILAADGLGGFLFRVTNPSSYDPADDREIMYLCSTRPHKALTLPAVPYTDLGVEAQPRRSVGLIAVPRFVPAGFGGHYLVAQLCPRTHDDNPSCFEWFHKPLQRLAAQLCLPSWAFRGDKLLCFATDNAPRGWFVKPLHTTAAVRMGNLCGETTRVLAHAGRLYWINLAYGIFFCDPFAEPSRLRFVPLPDGCQVWEAEQLSDNNRANVALRRRVAPSEGHLRYVEILGLSYDVDPTERHYWINPTVRMWTLVDPEAAEPWRIDGEHEARFAVVRKHQSYANFGLPDMRVPRVAFVDPDDHCVVYFLQGSKLYGLDLEGRVVVSCEDCPESVGDIIDAREWSLPTPPSPGENGERDRQMIDQVDSWLDKMQLSG